MDDRLTRWATATWARRLTRAGLAFLMLFCVIVARALWSISAEFAHDVPRVAYLHWPVMLLLWAALGCAVTALAGILRFLGRVRRGTHDGLALATWLQRCCAVATGLLAVVLVLVCTTPEDRYLVLMVLVLAATAFCATCLGLAATARALLLRAASRTEA